VGHNAIMAKISARGAVDLGALASARQTEQRAATAMAHAPAGVVIHATDATFETEVLQRSLQVPVVIDLWAEWCEPCKQLSPVLEMLAAEGAGQWVLAKIDVDANPAISQAFQVQSIPAVFAAIGGRVLPLFNGVYPEAQIRQLLDELLRVAAEQGLPGASLGESAAGADAAPAEPPADPRFDAAYAAIEQGDWSAADKAYRAVLAVMPNDPDAAAGIALVGIYARTEDASEPVSTTTPSDALLSADFAALRNEWSRAFDLSIGAVRMTSGEDRDAARQRVIEYFAVAGPDPAVPAARAALSSALF
jgi:putative thioredoxin